MHFSEEILLRSEKNYLDPKGAKSPKKFTDPKVTKLMQRPITYKNQMPGDASSLVTPSPHLWTNMHALAHMNATNFFSISY